MALTRVIASFRSGNLITRFSVVGAAVGLIVAAVVSSLVDAGLSEFMRGHVTARARDQIELGVLRYVLEPSDFLPPHSVDRIEGIASRLDPVLAGVRREGSGVIGLQVFSADGTVIYADWPEKRGTVTRLEELPGLASALQGSLVSSISELSSPESKRLKQQYGTALEVYVPFVIGGEVVGAYQLYQDLSPLRPLRPLVWGSVFSGFALLFLSLLILVRRPAAELARLASILEATTDFVAVVDRRGRYAYINHAARRMLGIGPDQPVKKISVFDARPEWVRAKLLEDGIPTSNREGAWSGETALIAADGSEVPVSEVLLTRKTATGRVGGYSMIARDITERKQWEAAVEHQALHDALTGLPNRVLLDDRLQQAILAAERAERPLAFLVMDLDRFKETNDTLGHHIGDLLLQHVSQRLAGTLRGSDTVARLGGDEFAVVLPGADAIDAALTAVKLRGALEEPFQVDGYSIEARSSIGIAVYPEHGRDAQTLLQHADVAMYVAKRGQSGYSVYAANLDDNSPSRLALVGELRRAIDLDQLMLYYQPQIDCVTSKVTRLEVLTRWAHPRRGLVLPDQFIPLAEPSGLIGPLTQWVLAAAIKQCRDWLRAGIEVPVAINISMRDLHDSRLPAAVAALLKSHDLPPELLWLEVTESGVMSDVSRAMDVLQRLRALGIRMSIDDFGTGYSSLAYLKQLPVDELKIDKSFVLHVTEDQNDAAIVRATVELGHQLGLRVLAEGVETQAAWELVRTVGCDMAQGYYFARPLPAHELTPWLPEARGVQGDYCREMPEANPAIDGSPRFGVKRLIQWHTPV